MEKLFSSTTRKAIYGVVIALNGLVGVLIPILVANSVLQESVAAQVMQIAASVVAVAGSIMAIKFVPAQADSSVTGISE